MVSCYHCKKPLPRCAVCLLNMGVVNPYSEEVFQQNKKSTISNTSSSDTKLRGARQVSGSSDSQPAHVTIPFSNWWVWCQKCKHGGHSSHLEEWYILIESCER